MNSDSRAVLQEAVLRYLGAKPWETLRDEHFFGVVDAETRLDGWASVAGNVGEEFGLGIYMGKEGRKTLERTLSLDLDVETQNDAADVIALTVADAQEAEAFREGTKLDATVEIGAKPVFPVVFRKPPGDTARVLRDKEATFLARVLTAISRTKEWGLDEDDVLDEVGGRLVLTVKGPTTNPEIVRSYDAPPPISAVHPEDERRLHEAKRTKRLLVRFADGKLVAMDPREKEVLLDDEVEGDSAAAVSTLVSELASRGILPREIWTDTPSLEEPLSVLGPFGVKVQVKLELKELRRSRGA